MEKIDKVYVQLVNPEVADKYVCLFTSDQVVHIPGFWKGKISKITIAAAEAFAMQKHPRFFLKPVDAKPKSIDKKTDNSTPKVDTPEEQK